MQPLRRTLCGFQRCVNGARSLPLQFSDIFHSNPSCGLSNLECYLPSSWRGIATNIPQHPTSVAMHNGSRFIAYRDLLALPNRVTLPTSTGLTFPIRHLTTVSHPEKAVNEDRSVASTDTLQPQCIKFKRLDKTARHIMNILDKEEVEQVRANREIPDIKPGYIVQLKVEVPENKRRVSILKGIVIARRNAGLHTTFRLRRMVAGVGVESIFPLYSPNIKEMKVLDKKDVRRAKLYYLRDRMNALKQK